MKLKILENTIYNGAIQTKGAEVDVNDTALAQSLIKNKVAEEMKPAAKSEEQPKK